MANGLAYLALFGFLPLGIALFSAFRPPVAALIVFLGSYMFLPEATELDLPKLPGLGKQEVAALACFFGCVLRARRKLLAARPLRGPDFWIVLLFIGDFGTALTNKDVITHGPTVLPALGAYEGVSLVIFDTLRYLLPFFLARALFTTAKDLRVLLAALAVAGAIYTPFLFVELMMSPQLHNWIYGFHQHDFLQTIRGGGYRPMVFMPHGLAVGLFMAWATMAAVTLFRAKKAVLGMPPQLVGIYDFAFLAWCKSLGAAIYALVGAPLLFMFKPKAIARIAAILGILVVTYPVLRATDIFPRDALVGAAANVSGRAAQSLEFRFDMEQLLTDHAAERPVFGWGRFRRNMIFDEWTGRDISVSDGHWIVTYSIRGAWGFVCIFGLIVTPLLVLRKRLKKIEAPDERMLLAGLGLILAIGCVDLLPNALQNVFLLFLAGALWGTAKGMANAPPDPALTSTTLPFAPGVPPIVPISAQSGVPPLPNANVPNMPNIPLSQTPRPFVPAAQPASGTRRKDRFE